MTDMVKAKLNGQFEIILPRERAEMPAYNSPEGWEKARLEAMHRHIKKGYVVYYVGAETGDHPALCALWGAGVVMFEPSWRFWPGIRAIWEANNIKPLGTYAGFCSNSTEERPSHLDFEVGEHNGWPLCAYGELDDSPGFRELYQESAAVPQIKIDDYVARTEIVPTIISFDVEGSEWQVMRGAEQTVRTYKPIIFASISPEFMFHQYGEYSRDFRNWIIDIGYEETILDFQHELHTMYVPKLIKEEIT